MYIESEQTKEIVDKYIGDGLGDWTDELEGNHMVFWCAAQAKVCLLYTSPSPRDRTRSRMPSSA